MDAMTKGQRNLLLFLLGVVILFVPIRFVALSNFDDRKELVSKKDEQQVYYNSLKAKDVNRDQYIKDTENYKKEYEAILAEFPSEIYQENISQNVTACSLSSIDPATVPDSDVWAFDLTQSKA